jgi:hypothetical protein
MEILLSDQTAGDRVGWPKSSSRPQKVRKHALAWSTLTVVVVGALAAGVVLVVNRGPTVPGAGIAPAAFVISSTQDTLAQHTADVIFSGSISVAGKTIPLNGTGEADFAANAFNGTVSFASSGLSLVERELAVGGHLYMGMTANGSDISQVTGGPEWIDIPLPNQSGSSAPGIGSVDPLSEIQLLEKKGATVLPLGTTVIDGATVSGYSVTPSRLEVFENIEQEIASGQIPPSEVQPILNESKVLGTFTEDVWFDASGLLRRESAKISGGSSGASGAVVMTFQNFGTPVSIQAPAPGNIVSFSQFTADLQALKGASG